jgi:hypothetical protein
MANENRREWGGMILESVILYGWAGRQNGPRGTSGACVHVLRGERVVGLTEPARPGTYAARFEAEARRAAPGAEPRPVFFSMRGICSGNGQHTATPRPDFGPADVTCSRCRKSAPRLCGTPEAR